MTVYVVRRNWDDDFVAVYESKKDAIEFCECEMKHFFGENGYYREDKTEEIFFLSHLKIYGSEISIRTVEVQ